MSPLHETPQWAVITFCGMLIVGGLYLRHYQRDDYRRLPKSDWAIRATGLYFIVLGPLGFYVLTYSPIQGALQHEPKIAVPVIAGIFAAMFVYLGLSSLVMGGWLVRIRARGEHQRAQRISRNLLVGGAVFCIAIELGFFYMLWRWGYH